MIVLKRTVTALSSIFLMLVFVMAPVYAQQDSGDLSPKTQQYIDNLNEVQQAANDGKPISNPSIDSAGKSPSVWNFVFYGFLSGAAYAFWRWLKRLKNGG